MARLNQMFDSDDDLPELSTILRSSTKATTSPIKKPVTKQDESKTSPRKKYCNDGNAGVSNGDVFSQGLSRLPFDANRFSNQRPLGLLKATQVNSLSLPIAKNFIETEGKVYLGESLIRSSPKRKAKTQVDYSKFAPRLSDVSLSSSESDDTFTDLSGFIVPDSASDVDVFPSRSQKSKDGKSFTKKTGDKPSKKDSCSHKVTPFEGKEDTGPIELTSPSKEKTLKMMCAESPPRFRTPPRLSESDRVYSGLDEPFSKLRLYGFLHLDRVMKLLLIITKLPTKIQVPTQV